MNASENAACRAAARVVALSLALALDSASAVETPSAPSFTLPEAGSALEHTLAGGGTRRFSFELQADDYVQLLVAPADTDVAVAVQGPDGATLAHAVAEMNFGLDSTPEWLVAFAAARAGTYVLELTQPDSAAWTAAFRLSVEARRPLRLDDPLRLEAYRLLARARRLGDEGTPADEPEALALCERALRLMGAISDLEGQARALGTRGLLLYDQSQSAEARDAITRQLALWTQLRDARREAQALSDLGLLDHLDSQHDAARAHLQDALARQEADGDVAAAAMTLTRLGWSRYATGDGDAALELARRALELRRRTGDRDGAAVALNDLGRALVDRGDQSAALDAYQEALALRPAGRDPRGAAAVLNRLAIAYNVVGETQRALDALGQALTLTRDAHDERQEATVRINLGATLMRVGEATEARAQLEQGLAQSRKLGYRGGEANALSLLAQVVFAEQDFGNTIELARQASAAHAAMRDARGEAVALRTLAHAQLADGRPQEALETVERAAGPNAVAIATGPNRYLRGQILRALGRDEDALAEFGEALRFYRDPLNPPRAALTQVHIAQILARRGEWDAAHTLMREGVATYQSQRRQLIDPELRLSFQATAGDPYEAQIALLMQMDARHPGQGLAAEAFVASESLRARGLLDLLADAGVDVRAGLDSELVTLHRRLHWDLDARAAIAARGGRASRAPRFAEEVAALQASLRETTARIGEARPEYAALVDAQPMSAAQVAALLGDHTVLIEFALGREHSYAWAVTGDGVTGAALPPRAEIELLARDVCALVTARLPKEASARERAAEPNASARLAARTRALSAMLFGPFASQLRDAWRGRRLAIVASGALEYVPFAALVLPQADAAAPRYLAAAHEIVTLPSASVLGLLRERAARRVHAPRAVAVLADPVFTADDPRLRREARRAAPALGAAATHGLRDAWRTRGAALTRLPFTRAEALAVIAAAPRGSTLLATGFEASRALATSGRLADYRIVHFATHGLVDATTPGLSSLALSMVDERGRPQDGFLRLDEIYNLRLRADLVVLSACRTALGKQIRGEGLVGLTRGFIYAGAPRVIASLWPVDDVATAELMTRFYRGVLRDGLRPAAALRTAQLELQAQRRFAAPYYWAGFVLQGDWE